MSSFQAKRKRIKQATKRMKNRQEVQVGVFLGASGPPRKTKKQHYQRKHKLKRMIKCSSIERLLGCKPLQQQGMREVQRIMTG
jgi:hypothetical protein